MTNKRRISVTGIITAVLLFFVFLTMNMPLTEYYGYYYGYRSYSFFYFLELAFENFGAFWALLHISLFMLINCAQCLAIVSIFKNKAGVGSAVTSGVAFNFLLIYAVAEGVELDEIGAGGYLMGLLLLGVFVLSIITAARGSSAEPACEPQHGYAGTVCHNCHRVMPAGGRFCPYCATPVPAMHFCAGCGTPVGGNRIYCSKCDPYNNFYNAPAAAPSPAATSWTCSVCLTENSSDYGQCKKCGTFRN